MQLNRNNEIHVGVKAYADATGTGPHPDGASFVTQSSVGRLWNAERRRVPGGQKAEEHAPSGHGRSTIYDCNF